MANLQSIQKRITSVKNTRQLTRAMKMVAAARLRRVKDKVEQTRPFAAEVLKMIQLVLEKTQHPERLSPYLSKSSAEAESGRSDKHVRVLAIGSDRGLCGAYNANVQKKLTQVISELKKSGYQVSVDAIGKHVHEYLKKRHPDVPSQVFQEFHAKFSRLEAIRLIDQYRAQFLEGKFDELGCVYTEFRSAMSQRVQRGSLMPITPEMMMAHISTGTQTPSAQEPPPPVTFEPSIAALANDLVVSFLDSRFYQWLLDAIASEHGARMTAMENATKNAKEMIEKLTLYYNKQRQAKITNELLDIVGGVEAMKKVG